MIDDAYKVDGYYPTIGIECHVQLKTKTKLFAAVDNDAREAAPNTLISHICLGLPGALPVLNEKAVELASKAAFALGTTPQPFSKFDRKHYFYPDLPMGYQITQFDQPVILGGSISANVDGKIMTFAITRAHLEADAGKSTHPAGSDYSLVDLNRAGTPLLEIVSEPCMHNAAEAKAYAHELYLLMKYADVSDVNLFYGNMRFDVNVSVSKDPNIMGTRTETKNLNSFRSVHDAVNYEIKRQIDVLESGQTVIQETRGWQDDTSKTFSQRSKEDAHDYRYFPDPDLPPIVLDESYINTIKEAMPLLPADYRTALHTIGIDDASIETLLENKEQLDIVTDIQKNHGNDHAKRVANWFLSGMGTFTSEEVEAITRAQLADKKDYLVELSQMVAENKLSSTNAKDVFKEVLLTDKNPHVIAEEKNLMQVSDTGELEAIVAEVLKANEKAAADVKNGEMKAIGFLVGQVMKASAGKANPGIVQGIIKKQLGV